MQYRSLGAHGLKVSALSFGAWITFGNQLGIAQCKELIACAYDRGVNFFDNAEGYANGQAELLMGQALAELGYSRDSWCVSSKVFFASAKEPKPTQKGLSRKHMIDAAHQALQRLQVDYLDLYFCHRPDPSVPVSEIVWTMHQLIMAGKVLYWGTSEWPAKDIQAAHDFAKANSLIGPVVEQSQYNLLHRERFEKEYESLYLPENVGMGTTTWSPLASGLLSGKYKTTADLDKDGRFALENMDWLKQFAIGEDGDRKLAQIARLGEIAKTNGMSMAQLSIGWCLQNPNVSTVILGASKTSQLNENLDTLNYLDRFTPTVMRDMELALLGM
jgi:voltage-dependent potassium channel beta subunit